MGAEQESIIKTLEKRLEKHDNNRKVVQSKLINILNKLTKQINELEDRINRELCEKFTSEEDRLQGAFNELRGNSTISALQKAKTELRTVQSYELIENREDNNDITTLYELKTEMRTVPDDVSVGLAISEMNGSTNGPSNVADMSETACYSNRLAEERERLMESLKERLKNMITTERLYKTKSQRSAGD